MSQNNQTSATSCEERKSRGAQPRHLATYRNPWHKPASGHDPEFYRTDAKPVQIGKYVRYHRIKSSNPSTNCYDFVLNGVCFAQRCGPADEATIEGCEYAQDNLRRIFGKAAA